ncbi:MAG: hypothetical protein GY810_20045 [Aureispira sp.]|nr:hypothetical protein [Aureispira sp.]
MFIVQTIGKLIKNTFLLKITLFQRKKQPIFERQNLNFRTHLKRLARETLCSSKEDDMHYGAYKGLYSS